ncbi:unnamed protein product [Acanthoscelides obtectus]|uniref:C2H2-type domain-containing protein n=1 Tax=Acanthoscelides obtectus TaxID=200917 RepID=A0A9P0KPH2_ACAOB|nr:unnamed protein product [Acanthoscelides obtectus]CAK1675637.1 Zinc finger and BTB domain-containing protein 41 [Acanthoscelides obtectus]
MCNPRDDEEIYDVDDEEDDESTNIQCGMCNAIFPNKQKFFDHSPKFVGGFYECCKCKARFRDVDALYNHFDSHRKPGGNEMVLNYEDQEVLVQSNEANDQLLYILDEETQCVNEVVVEQQERPVRGMELVNMEHGYVLDESERIIEEEELEDEDGNIVIRRRVLSGTPKKLYRTQSQIPNKRTPQPKRRHEEPDFSAANYEYVEANDVIEVPHYKCMRCEQLFINKFGFFRHIEKGKCYTNNCDVCNATFSSNSDFFAHYTQCHTDRAVCNFCFRTFMYEKNVKEHMLRHLDQFRHRCEECSKGFYTVREYRNHYKNRHMGIRHKCEEKISNPSKQKYRCAECFETFTDKAQLETHKHSHKTSQDKIGDVDIKREDSFEVVEEEIGIGQLNDKDADFMCDRCYDVFRTKKELEEHMDFHEQLSADLNLNIDESIDEPVIGNVDETLTVSLCRLSADPDLDLNETAETVEIERNVGNEAQIVKPNEEDIATKKSSEKRKTSIDETNDILDAIDDFLEPNHASSPSKSKAEEQNGATTKVETRGQPKKRGRKKKLLLEQKSAPGTRKRGRPVGSTAKRKIVETKARQESKPALKIEDGKLDVTSAVVEKREQIAIKKNIKRATRSSLSDTTSETIKQEEKQKLTVGPRKRRFEETDRKSLPITTDEKGKIEDKQQKNHNDASEKRTIKKAKRHTISTVTDEKVKKDQKLLVAGNGTVSKKETDKVDTQSVSQAKPAESTSDSSSEIASKEKTTDQAKETVIKRRRKGPRALGFAESLPEGIEKPRVPEAPPAKTVEVSDKQPEPIVEPGEPGTEKDPDGDGYYFIEQEDPRYVVLLPNSKVPRRHYKCVKCKRIAMSIPDFHIHLKELCHVLITRCSICSSVDFEGNIGYYRHFIENHHKRICRSKALSKEDTKKLGTKKLLMVKLTRIEKDQTLVFKEGKYQQRRRRHTCYVCMKKFYTFKELVNHKATHLSSDSEEESVKIAYTKTKEAEKSSENRDNLSSEEKNATGSKIKADKIVENEESKKAASKFKCDTCNVFFNSLDEAKAHPYQKSCKFSCKVCKRRFNTLYAMLIHMLQHKTNEEAKKSSGCIYKCDICDKAFSDCFQVHRHQIQFHKIKSKIRKQTAKKKNTEEQNVTLQINSYTCDLCYDEFSSKKEFDAHMEFHEQLNNDNSEPSIQLYKNSKFEDPQKSSPTQSESSTSVSEAPKHVDISDTIVIDDDEVDIRGGDDKVIDAATSKSAPETPKSKQVLTESILKDWNDSETIETATSEDAAPASSKNNQQLTELILKEMMGKQFEPRVKPKKSKSQRNVEKKKPEMTPIEVQQTGPLSYQVVYTDDESGATTSIATATKSETSTTSTLLSYQIVPQSAQPGTAAATSAIGTPPKILPRLTPMRPSQPGKQNVQSVPQVVPQSTSYITTPQAQTVQATPSTSVVNPTDPTSIAYVIIPPSNKPQGTNLTLTPQMTNAIISAFKNQINVAQSSSPSFVFAPNEVAPASPTPLIPTLPIISNVTSMATAVSQTVDTTETTSTMSGAQAMANVQPLVHKLPALLPTFQKGTTKKATNMSSSSAVSETPKTGTNSTPSTTVTFTITVPSTTTSSASAKEQEPILIESDSDDEDTGSKSTDTASEPGGFISVKRLEDLIEKKQETKETKYKCSKCGLDVEKLHDMKSHYLDHHNLYLCQKCGFETTSVTDFGSHRISVHTCTRCLSFCNDLSTHKCSSLK